MTERIDALPGRGVTMCGWTQIADTETELMRQPRPDGHHAYLSGLQMCGLRWVCPICTAKAAQADRQDVNDGLAAARAMGLFPVMVTLTTRHRRGEAAQACRQVGRPGKLAGIGYRHLPAGVQPAPAPVPRSRLFCHPAPFPPA